MLTDDQLQDMYDNVIKIKVILEQDTSKLKDHEKRLRIIENKVGLFAGGCIVISAIISFIIGG